MDMVFSAKPLQEKSTGQLLFQVFVHFTKARLTFIGSLSDEIVVANGLKEGGIHAATLFSV